MRCGPVPFGGEGGGGFEDGRGVGEEAAVPEVGAAAVEDVDEVGGGGDRVVAVEAGAAVGAGALEVEGEGAAGFVLAVDDDEVVADGLAGRWLRRVAAELRTGAKVCRPRWAARRKPKAPAARARLAAWGRVRRRRRTGGERAEEEAERGEGERQAEEAEGAGC